MPGYDSWKTRSPDEGLESPDEPSTEQQLADYEDSIQQSASRCDVCKTDGDVRLSGELLGPDVRQACRKCLGVWTTNWFYMRRPGDFDDDALSKTERSEP